MLKMMTKTEKGSVGIIKNCVVIGAKDGMEQIARLFTYRNVRRKDIVRKQGIICQMDVRAKVRSAQAMGNNIVVQVVIVI